MSCTSAVLNQKGVAETKGRIFHCYLDDMGTCICVLIFDFGVTREGDEDQGHKTI